MSDIQNYRQPLVTATGFFLGFELNTTSTWIKDAFAVHFFRDIILGIGTIASLSLLLLVLIRILRIKDPADPARYYRKTMIFFFIGVSIPFVAMLIIMIEKFVIRVSA